MSHTKEKKNALYQRNSELHYLSILNQNPYRQEASPKSFLYQDRGCSSSLSGSAVIEAVLAVPLFFLALFSLCWILRIMTVQNMDQVRLGEAALSYACTGTKIATVTSVIEGGSPILWKKQKGETYCYLRHKENIPFLGKYIFCFYRYQQIGTSDYMGRSMAGAQSEEQMVYISENASVYHLLIDCTYLKPHIQNYQRSMVDGLRNASGGKYYPCEDCCHGKDVSHGTVVYLAHYGTRFHCDQTCSKLKRSVRTVPLSQVGNLGPCSKCGKEQNHSGE